jgi:hypothetical protein
MLARAHPSHAARALSDAKTELVRTFRREPDKHAAHRLATPILEQVSRDPAFLTGALEAHIATPGALDVGNYPVVSLKAASNPYFEIAINCWIPLPTADTHVTTKAIHHHGTLLLSTATIFGAGYEHLLFERPVLVDAAQELFALRLLERAPHPQHHVAFVDAWLPHVPMYPSELTITAALWSSSAPTTWKDFVKRIPALKKNEKRLRAAARRLGLTKQLDVKVIDYFDYFPVGNGFRGMKDREEFRLGPNAEHLKSLFHVVQRTGNAQLLPLLREGFERALPATRAAAQPLLDDLAHERPIWGHLSEGHFNIPFANFTKTEIEHALRALPAETTHGRKLAPSPHHQAHPGAHPE